MDYKKNVKGSGIPLIYAENTVFTTKDNSHSLIVGSMGSGKTQTMILPLIKLSMLAGESVVVNDPKGDIYKMTAKEFKKREYNTIVLDFDNSIYGNHYNPFDLAYKLYKDNKKDKAMDIIEEIGYYIFTDNKSAADPFWTISTINYFTGLCLYLFKTSNECINLKDVFKFANKFIDDKESEKLLKEVSDDDSIYCNICGTLAAPKETRGSIVATFNQKLKKYVSKENLSKMMSKTDFDISSIANDKTVIYIVSGYSDYSNTLIPLFINQVFETVNIYGKHEKKINIILDEFDNLLPIKNFSEIISYSRGININFTCVIKSFINLVNTYGKENSEIIKLCFSNIVYLYANDLVTLEEISKLCGNESDKKPLISPEELKMLEPFEAVFLIPRVMPFKNKLLPDYKINWGIDFEESEFELMK